MIKKRFHDGQCWYIIGEFGVDCPEDSYAWHLYLTVYNSKDSICYVPQMKQKFIESVHQLTSVPVKSDSHNLLSHSKGRFLGYSLIGP